MTYYLLGVNSFIAKSYYIHLRKQREKVICLTHKNLELISKITNDDILINFCGVNRSDMREKYDQGNHLFLREVYGCLDKTSLPYFIHISSYMVNGFEDQLTSGLPDYQVFFIESKLEGEKFLQENYPNDKFCIVRPSNIYGYSCEPYYNNLLVTMMYEKINGNTANDMCAPWVYKITKINRNCERNFLSVEGLICMISDLIRSKKSGLYNMVSNQNLTFDNLIKLIYASEKELPKEICIIDGERSVSKRVPINGEILMISENLVEKLVHLEKQMKNLLQVKNLVKLDKTTRLSQPRGDMVEISNLNSKRLYMITLTDHSVRGNHYHFEQIEDFYVHRGILIFLLAHKDDPTTIYTIITNTGDKITVNPPIIHTLVNDFIGQIPEIVITSTFPYVANSVPDTVYINLV